MTDTKATIIRSRIRKPPRKAGGAAKHRTGVLVILIAVLVAGCSTPAETEAFQVESNPAADVSSTTTEASTTVEASTTIEATAETVAPATTEASTAPAAEPEPAPAGPDDPPPRPEDADGGSERGEMNILNTLSDHAQATTIAFDALAFMTGNRCADSFFPPGKVSDFFGFQYLRDNEPDGFGHNTAFAATVGENVLSLLNDEQVGLLVELAEGQTSDINDYAYGRLPIIDAFRRLLADDLPAGDSDLSIAAVEAQSAEIYGLDGQISFDRAAVFADILNGLTPGQAEEIAALAATGVADWPDRSQDVDELKRQLDRDAHVALMTVAGQLFSWYDGEVDSDTYFCPERHGTYFGSFYMKDIPAMLSQQSGTDVTINENLTGEYGNRFLDLLDTDQRALIEGLVDTQRPVMEELVVARTAIASQLRLLWGDDGVDSSAIRAEVVALSEHYGELDGQLVALYAITFDTVYESLSEDQLTALWSLRQSAENLGLVDDPCSPDPDGLAYLYSDAVDAPVVENTVGFFQA